MIRIACATTLAVVAVATFAIGGSAVAAPATTHHRATVVVHTTRKHNVIAPTGTRPGVARLKNTGTQAVFVITSRHGAGTTTLARDLNASTAGGLIKHFTIADSLPAKATTYLHLARGTYYLADISRDHFTAASIRTLHVTGSTVNAVVPKARAVVVHRGNTITSPAGIAISSEVRIGNKSAHLQVVFLWRVGKDVPDDTLSTFLAKPSVKDLGKIISGEPRYLAIMSPHLRATSSNHSTAGRYLLMTFPFTSASSQLHLKAGQVRLLTVK